MHFKRGYPDPMPPNEAVFHYCSPDTFRRIVESRTLHFSSVECMNDVTELTWGYGIFQNAMSRWCEGKGRDDRGGQFVLDLYEEMNRLRSSSLYLAVCLSKNGDLLSQWNSYAENGFGFAIGFDLGALNFDLNHTALAVEYHEPTLVAEALDWIEEIFAGYPYPAVVPGSKYLHGAPLFAADTVAYKHPSFSQELEVRLIKSLITAPHPMGGRGINPGFYRPQDSARIEYRMNKMGVPVPYLPQRFEAEGPYSAIRSVVIGPRNHSSTAQIQDFLNHHKIHGVQVSKSVAPVRPS